MKNKIEKFHDMLGSHSLFNQLLSQEDLQVFMKYHVFAVWDFMSLLKSLQKKITCVEIPWQESKYSPELVQLVNEIVLGEESDEDQYGNPCSHFSLYLKAMDEIGADTTLIKKFLETQDYNLIPKDLAEIISFHIDLAMTAKDHEVASSFFYGREKLIPSMFESILKVLEENNLNCPTLLYYFKRHIEVDSENHGPKALKCLNQLADTEVKESEIFNTAKESLNKRKQLWDFIENEIYLSRSNWKMTDKLAEPAEV